jgi:guanylate kinase
MKKDIKNFCLVSPSGGGKGTVKKYLLEEHGDAFMESISGASRLPRGNEKEGIDYYFRTVEQFQQDIADDKFAEWEMVYEGKYYGTYKSEIDRIAGLGKIALFDIDYKGAQSIATAYPDTTLILGILPPSLEALEERLRARGTESEDDIQKRLRRAPEEIKIINQLDHVVVNYSLSQLFAEVDEILKQYEIGKKHDYGKTKRNSPVYGRIVFQCN